MTTMLFIQLTLFTLMTTVTLAASSLLDKIKDDPELSQVIKGVFLIRVYVLLYCVMKELHIKSEIN